MLEKRSNLRSIRPYSSLRHHLRPACEFEGDEVGQPLRAAAGGDEALFHKCFPNVVRAEQGVDIGVDSVDGVRRCRARRCEREESGEES